MSIELPPGTADYTDRSPPPKNRQLLLLFSFLIGLIAVIVTSVGVMANLLVALVPYSVEQQLGRLMLPAYEQLAQPSSAQTTLNQLLDRLEAQLPAEQQNRDYQILYIPDNTVNAAALPGDRIIVFQGLLTEMESENELIMILGHELGHFAHRDHLRQLGRGLLTQLVLTSLLGDTSGLQSIAISGTAALSDARFSQRQEYQADQFGLTLLQQTYGQVAGATDFFERLSKAEIGVDFLATHPGSKQRIQKIKRIIAQRGYGEGIRSPLPSELVREDSS
jgi:predicted Zn-dependent protease